MMHGQTKQKGEILSEEEIKQRAEKGQKILDSLEYFFKVRKNQIQQPEDPLAFTEIMAKLCPEIGTIYNYRREILLNKFEKLKSDLIGLSLEAYKQLMKLIQSEFMLIAILLKQHPKSYTLWTHRQWMVLRSQEIDQIISTLPQEFKQIEATKLEYELCSKMLDKDERNFHVWNYRNWLSSINPYGQEDEFTKKKIEQNFSNFSAYHFRSKFFMKNYNQPHQILERIKNEGVLGLAPLPFDRLLQETDLIQQAIYIQPKEHGVYLYQRWLVGVVQPFGVRCVKSVSNTQIILQFNKKVFNIEGCVKLYGSNDEEIVVQITQNEYDIVLRFEEQPTTELRVRLINNLYENQDIQSLTSEDEFSTFFIPCEIKLQGEQIIIQEPFKEAIAKITNYLDENISFIKQIIEEEPNNRFPLIQVLYLLQFKWNHEQKQSIVQESLKYCEQLINLQNDHQANFLLEFWQSLLLIVKI